MFNSIYNELNLYSQQRNSSDSCWTVARAAIRAAVSSLARIVSEPLNSETYLMWERHCNAGAPSVNWRNWVIHLEKITSEILLLLAESALSTDLLFFSIAMFIKQHFSAAETWIWNVGNI